MSNSNERMESATVSRLAVRLPPFWPHNPLLWFAQVEASFNYSGVTTDATKFALVVSQLDQRYATEVQDIITSPPTENAYERLKAELIRRISASQEDRIRQVLTQEDIGDRKPSQYLRHLRSKVDTGTVPDSLLRSIWSSRLPPQVKAIVASQADMSLDAVAELADRIQEAITPSPQVSAVNMNSSSASRPPSVSRADYDALSAKVDALSAQISALLTQRSDKRYRGRSRERSKSRSSTRSTSDAERNVCWYHRRFGDQAKKCTRPCDYPNADGSRL